MVEGIPPRPRNEERDETGQVDEGHLAVAFAREDTAMNDKKGHRHGHDERHEGKPGRQADDQKQGAEHFGENHQIDAQRGPHPERIGKTLDELAVVFDFAPTVEQQHRQTEPDPEHQKSDILEPFPAGTGNPLRVRFDHDADPIRPALEPRRK